MPSQPLVGVDLGGTKIIAAVVAPDGRILGEVIQVSTGADRPREEILRDIRDAVRQSLRKAGLTVKNIAGVGIGAPGPLDLERGIVLTPPNLPTLHHCPLKEEMEGALGCPVYVNNDGNCFVLGEAYFGAGRGARIVAGVTLGTGLGCGVVLQGRIFGGATGTAAEIWISPYEHGIVEDYLSGRGVRRIYLERSGGDLDAEEIHRRAQQGEREALGSWMEYGIHLGRVLAWMVNLIDPDFVVVGGSISQAWNFFQASMHISLRQFINPRPREHVQVVKATLGNLAGVYGAAALVFVAAGDSLRRAEA